MPKTNEEKKESVVTIRMTHDLHDRIKESAEQDFRSVTNQITFLLEKGLQIRNKQKLLEEQAVFMVAETNQNYGTG